MAGLNDKISVKSLGIDKKQLLPAATLIEVLISLVIIMAVFVVGVAIFTRVTQSAKSNSTVAADRQMKGLLLESVKAGDMEDEVINIDSIVYYKSVLPYKDYPDLLQIKIVAVQHETTLDSIIQIVRKGGDE